jgi:uncharacterized protein YdeI (BOF family)
VKGSRARRTVGQVFVVVVALVLIAGLAGGCAADEPSDDQAPGTGMGSGGPADGGGTSGTRPAGELPEGATHAIADVLDTPSDGAQVVLVGEIAQMVDAENFMLKDSTGEVYVDGDNDFGALAVGDAVSVTGTVKIEDSPTRVEIQATAVERR